MSITNEIIAPLWLKFFGVKVADFPKGAEVGEVPPIRQNIIKWWEGTLLTEKIRQTVYETLVVLKGETLFGVSSISSY